MCSSAPSLCISPNTPHPTSLVRRLPFLVCRTRPSLNMPPQAFTPALRDDGCGLDAGPLPPPPLPLRLPPGVALVPPPSAASGAGAGAGAGATASAARRGAPAVTAAATTAARAGERGAAAAAAALGALSWVFDCPCGGACPVRVTDYDGEPALQCPGCASWQHARCAIAKAPRAEEAGDEAEAGAGAETSGQHGAGWADHFRWTGPLCHRCDPTGHGLGGAAEATERGGGGGGGGVAEAAVGGRPAAPAAAGKWAHVACPQCGAMVRPNQLLNHERRAHAEELLASGRYVRCPHAGCGKLYQPGSLGGHLKHHGTPGGGASVSRLPARFKRPAPSEIALPLSSRRRTDESLFFYVGQKVPLTTLPAPSLVVCAFVDVPCTLRCC